MNIISETTKRVFLFNFDESLMYWDHRTKQYVPRPYMHKLLSLINDLGHISIINSTANILDQLFISRYLYFMKNNKIHTDNARNLINDGYEVIHIVSSFCRKCSENFYRDNEILIPIKPHFTYLIDKEEDNELLVLKNYLKYKLNFTDDISIYDIDFSDWNDRLILDNTDFPFECNNACNI